MNLRLQAEADLGAILEDSAMGFGWAVVVTDPDGKVGNLDGFTDDISQIIDPDTGQAVTGRLASATLRISSLTEEGLGLPKSIADSSKKPWTVEFEDVNGSSFLFKVSESNPDRTLGIVVCMLEAYE